MQVSDLKPLFLIIRLNLHVKDWGRVVKICTDFLHTLLFFEKEAIPVH